MPAPAPRRGRFTREANAAVKKQAAAGAGAQQLPRALGLHVPAPVGPDGPAFVGNATPRRTVAPAAGGRARRTAVPNAWRPALELDVASPSGRHKNGHGHGRKKRDPNADELAWDPGLGHANTIHGGAQARNMERARSYAAPRRNVLKVTTPRRRCIYI